MKALIAAGGSGTRLRPLTFSSNKHLLPVANKPLLLYPFESIVEVGIKEIGIVVNETRPAIEALLGDGSKWNVTITYIEQRQPLGLAHVVKICEDFIAGEPFVYHLGDNIFSEGIKRPFEHFIKTKPDALLTMVEHEENFRLGVPFFNPDGSLQKVVEKPENPPNKFGVPGLYFFNHHVFEAFKGADAIKPSKRGELEITDLYTYLLDHHYRVETEEVDGRWMDPGKFVDMLEANAYLLDRQSEALIEGEVDEASKVDGVVVIGTGSVINECQITGPVNIGENCRLTQCTIGPHVSIEAGCEFKGITVENSVVMRETKIMEVDSPIRDSLIGKHTVIRGNQHNSSSFFIGDDCTVDLR